jgi:hypothetical protein
VGANARAHGQTLVNSHEARAVDELGRGTVTSPHERRLGTYGSEGWGFESLRARNVCPGQMGYGLRRLLDDLARENILRTSRVLTMGGGHAGEAHLKAQRKLQTEERLISSSYVASDPRLHPARRRLVPPAVPVAAARSVHR